MADQTEDDIEFIPSDEDTEAEPDGAEQGAVHVEELEEPRGLVIVEAEEFEADQLEEEAVAEDHEEDLEEILCRHYGIVSEEPEGETAGEEPRPRPPSSGEFVCRSCFLRRAVSQLSDPARGLCVDCVRDGLSAA
jgi:hypothetical protein